MTNAPPSDDWRYRHSGHWLRLASQRFDARVLALMAQDAQVPLGLSRLAQREQVGAAIVHITRHLAPQGMRLTDLASAAGMSKQSMGALVLQCEAWGLVLRTGAVHDARVRCVHFTPTGQAWLQACERATQQAQAELEAAVGPEVATVVALGLEAYCSH